MVQFFKDLKIRVKLLLAFSSILLLSIVLVLFFYFIDYKQSRYEKAGEDIDAMRMHLLEMDGAARYFIFEGYKDKNFHVQSNSLYISKFLEHSDSIHSVKIDLPDQVFTLPLNSIQQVNKQLNQTFKAIVVKLKERGFKDYGLEGSLREAIHNVEQSNFPYNKADMLMLRRHEKDFFLRKDLKYLNEFIAKHELLVKSIEQSPDGEVKTQLIKDLNTYLHKFKAIVAVETDLGLTEESGLKANINQELSALQTMMAELRTAVKEADRSFNNIAATLLVLVFFIQLALALIISLIYADLITRPIKELKTALQQLSEGIYPKALIVRSQEEIGKTKLAFNQLVERMQAASGFATALGHGELNREYPEKFQQDVLAQSLLKMREELAEAQAQQAIQSWTNEGLAKLNEVLKRNTDTLEITADQLLQMLIHYIPANQGVVYIISKEGGDRSLQRMATYAYGKKKFVTERIAISEGLSGQCMLEKNTILLTDVPESYLKITSGLGEALPRFVGIFPLKYQEEVIGTLELASFEKLEYYKITFIEKVCEHIASVMLSKIKNEESVNQLQHFKLMEQRLKQEQEALQQAQEQMYLQQERLQVEKEELEFELKKLRKQMSPQEAFLKHHASSN